MQLIVLHWQWAKHLVRSSCFYIFVMKKGSNYPDLLHMKQSSYYWATAVLNNTFVCGTLLCCVKINTIFPPFFSRPNLLKAIPTRLNGTLSSTSCPRRLWFLPLYRGLAVLQSPTMVSRTYWEITKINGIHWYLSSKNLHQCNKFWNSIFFHSWNHFHPNL